eukprot:TRINITY_DN5526_c0_g1_i1.p1 TRINITY_DN5526_c0_g1~~TRINITY_DN5526_c0_g1_i1.p1  ORF type:complete len:810 (-),score=226.04 TRINITY_DN5526_c0_g1_i1:122-2551(-)
MPQPPFLRGNSKIGDGKVVFEGLWGLGKDAAIKSPFKYERVAPFDISSDSEQTAVNLEFSGLFDGSFFVVLQGKQTEIKETGVRFTFEPIKVKSEENETKSNLSEEKEPESSITPKTFAVTAIGQNVYGQFKMVGHFYLEKELLEIEKTYTFLTRPAVRTTKKRSAPTVKKTTNKKATIKLASEMNQCDALLKKIKSHRWSYPFNSPVDPIKLNIPDYFTIVKEPMDLGTVQRKIRSQEIGNVDDFAHAVRRTFNNALIFNNPTTDVHKMADTLLKLFDENFARLQEANFDPMICESIIQVIPITEIIKKEKSQQQKDLDGVSQLVDVIDKTVDSVSAAAAIASVADVDSDEYSPEDEPPFKVQKTKVMKIVKSKPKPKPKVAPKRRAPKSLAKTVRAAPPSLAANELPRLQPMASGMAPVFGEQLSQFKKEVRDALAQIRDDINKLSRAISSGSGVSNLSNGSGIGGSGVGSGIGGGLRGNRERVNRLTPAEVEELIEQIHALPEDLLYSVSQFFEERVELVPGDENSNIADVNVLNARDQRDLVKKVKDLTSSARRRKRTGGSGATPSQSINLQQNPQSSPIPLSSPSTPSATTTTYKPPSTAPPSTIPHKLPTAGTPVMAPPLHHHHRMANRYPYNVSATPSHSTTTSNTHTTPAAQINSSSNVHMQQMQQMQQMQTPSVSVQSAMMQQYIASHGGKFGGTPLTQQQMQHMAGLSRHNISKPVPRPSPMAFTPASRPPLSNVPLSSAVTTSNQNLSSNRTITATNATGGEQSADVFGLGDINADDDPMLDEHTGLSDDDADSMWHV